MTHNTSTPLGFLAVGLFGLMGIFGAGPISDMIDCNDSFWAVACEIPGAATLDPGAATLDPAIASNPTSQANLLPGSEEPVLQEETRRIDNDVECATLENGDMLCHS